MNHREEWNMAKRSRGIGGRRPQGEFGGLTAPLSMRMPEHLRAQLEAAAAASGRSLSQEVLYRLDATFDRAGNAVNREKMHRLVLQFVELVRAEAKR